MAAPTAAVRRATSLRRMQLLARLAFTGGAGVSVAGNVLAAHTFVGRCAAVWIPVAFLLSSEMVLRVKATNSLNSRARAAATGFLALIAAWVSYWHMVDTLRAAGETGVSLYAIPLTPDGLMIISTVTILELSDRLSRGAVAQDAATKAAATRAIKALEPEPVPVAPARPTRRRAVVKPATAPVLA